MTLSDHYQEDDDLEKLKTWWKNYGSALLIGVVLGTGGLYGYRYWNQYQYEQAAQASAYYDQVIYYMKTQETDKAISFGGQIMEQHASTPYAGMAALLLARISFDSGKLASARKQLTWAMENAKDAAIRHAARLRLARIMGEAGEADSALALLSMEDKGGFASEYSELKGDLYFEQGKVDDARTAYKNAITANTSNEYIQHLQMKLDNLGQKESSQKVLEK